MTERQVVTCFLLWRAATGDRLLLVRRSQQVRTYQGRWAAISGAVDTTPAQQALTEIAEETGLRADQVRLIVQGEPLTVDDPTLERRWIVHPFLFAVADPAAVRTDWEAVEACWVAPAELAAYPTVPGLAAALARVYPPPEVSQGGDQMDATVAAIFDGYREVHHLMRAELERLDPALLHVAPAPETNPIAVLVHHTLGSEGEVVRVVAGLPSTRDRAAEFRVTAADLDLASLRAALDAADRLLDEAGPLITPARLQAVIERPPRTPRTGLVWLVTNYGHAREHLAHLELTRQLLAQARP